MSEFIEAIDSVGGESGIHVWPVPDGWQQGRGAWGGLVVGAMVYAVQATEPDPARSIRTVSAHLFGPTAEGTAEITVRPLRIGSAMSTWSVDVVDSTGSATASGVVITGAPRADAISAKATDWGTLTAPAVPAWTEVPITPIRMPIGPIFADHLEYRLVDGIPYTAGAARALGWIRFPDQAEWSADQVLGIIDAWWPTALHAMTEPHPMATVSFAAHLLIDPASIPAGEPLICEAFMSGAFEGFTTETRRLWTADGRLVAENHQSIVIIT